MKVGKFVAALAFAGPALWPFGAVAQDGAILSADGGGYVDASGAVTSGVIDYVHGSDVVLRDADVIHTTAQTVVDAGGGKLHAGMYVAAQGVRVRGGGLAARALQAIDPEATTVSGS